MTVPLQVPQLLQCQRLPKQDYERRSGKIFHTHTHHRKLVELAHVTVQCTAVSRSLAFQSQWLNKKCMRTEMVKASH